MVKQIPDLLHIGQTTNADTKYLEIIGSMNFSFGGTLGAQFPTSNRIKRVRDDNEPYVPEIYLDVNKYDDEAVEKWVLEKIEETSQKSTN